jgi:hypothetical protein
MRGSVNHTLRPRAPCRVLRARGCRQVGAGYLTGASGIGQDLSAHGVLR